MPEQIRALPSVPDSEAWVLGSILTEPWRMDEVATIVRPGDFYVEANAIVFETMQSMYAGEKAIDHVSLVRQLQKSPLMLKASDGNVMAVLLPLTDAAPLPAHAVWHAKQVREASLKRGIILACEAGAVEGYDCDGTATELLARVEARIISVQDDRVSGSLCHAAEAANEFMDAMSRRIDGEEEPEGVPTGFADLDRYLTTLRPGELTILAARPGMGKTALAANVATFAALDRKTATLFVSLEMSKLELADRVLSGRSGVRLSDMREGRILPEERKALVAAAAELGQGPFWIDDSPARNVLEIAATARRLKRRYNLGLLIVDYLQLIEPEDARSPREQQVATMSRRLKRLARELSIPVLCLAQLNRVNEGKPNKRPMLSNLRESGAIEQDADVVLFIHREEYYLSPSEAASQNVVGKAEAIIAKQRNGRTGVAHLVWQENNTQFLNASRVWQGGDEWNPRD